MLKGGGRVLLSKIQRAQHTCDSIANISGVWRCFSEVWCWGQLLCNYFFTIHNYCVTTSEIAKTTWVPKPRFSHVCVGGCLGRQVSGVLFTPQPTLVTSQPTPVSVFERGEGMRSREHPERNSKMPNSERFSRSYHTLPAHISEKY